MNECLSDKKIIKLGETTLSDYRLCDHCFGRLFAKIDHGITNKERGETLRKSLKQDKKTKVHECWLCSGLIDEIPHFADLISDTLKEYEFETFLVGSKVEEDILEREQKLLDVIKTEYAEPIKMELNREIGKRLEERLGKEVDFENPTIIAVIDTAFDVVHLQVRSLFIYGRYKKFRRDIPQTRWFCRVCRGKGCKRCDYTGKMYETSVEELVAEPFLEQTMGTDATLHGSGREDIDVRMLGNGRPFVLEIKNPRRRTLDLSELEQQSNASMNGKVEVKNLRYSDKDEIRRIKNNEFRKTYRVVFRGEKALNKEKLKEAARILRGKIIQQSTPSRVIHRRSKRVRDKKIYSCDVESIDGTIATLQIETESGTYIKELISGDNGRTKPNISDLIDVSCHVEELDVVEIKGE